MTESYELIHQSQPTYYFFGVTTGKSSINRIFPLWVAEMGRPEVRLQGVDLKIHDTRENYRRWVYQVKDDPNSIGGLVTTHKIDMFEAARDLFNYADPYAQICGEISSISKMEGRLEGHAFDPITAGLSLTHIIGSGYFGRTGGEILCLGGGGSGVATLLHLLNQKEKADRPSRFIVVNRSQGRLDRLAEMLKRLPPTDIQIEMICNQDPKINDDLMSRLPDYSIVINATGMGKDTPGSPVTDEGLFPKHGIAWEFNYRGELDFMHQAEKQIKSRELTVEDGWIYFVYGWTKVMEQVLHVKITPEQFERMAEMAAKVR